MVDRTDREQATRAQDHREMTWAPPNILPDPLPQPGWVFRWIRTAITGNSDTDPANVSMRFREGWVPCKAEDHPEITVISDNKDSRFKGNIEIGGLLLCKMPKEVWDQRVAYYDKLARSQLEAVEQNHMRNSDPRMPLLQPERRVTSLRGRMGNSRVGAPIRTSD